MPIATDHSPLLTDQQVAARLNCSITTARRLRYSHVLPTVRVGRLARVPLAALDELIDKQLAYPCR